VADELCESGRRVFLSVGSNGRVPRRYRGKDCYVWVGLGDLNTKAGKYSNHAHVSGKAGGKNMNLHQFALDGIVLLSRVQGVENGRLLLGSDLYERLENADRAAKEFMQTVDAYIEREGIDAPPPDPPPELSAGFQQELLSEVDLAAENITNVIWATGFTFDLGWVKFDVLDSRGFPDQRGRGVTNVPGLYFVGYSWEFQPKSVFVGSAGGEAEFVVNHIEKDG